MRSWALSPILQDNSISKIEMKLALLYLLNYLSKLIYLPLRYIRRTTGCTISRHLHKRFWLKGVAENKKNPIFKDIFFYNPSYSNSFKIIIFFTKLHQDSKF